MYIEKIRLKDYHRTALSGVTDMEITFTTQVQLILGTNGSGKSSLLSELSPLPGVPAQFGKNGFKKIWITHQGASYYLESTFKSGGHHSFQRDGEELNPGHTYRVQLDLCRQYFNWTPELQQLLTGRQRFTTMSPSKRREWIARLSRVSYEYAIKVHQKLAKKARDTSGSLDRVRQRLTQESNNLKMLGGESVQEMEERMEILRREVNMLLTAQEPNLPGIHAAEQRLQGLVRETQELARTMVERKLPEIDAQYTSLDEMEAERINLRSAIATNRAIYDRAVKEFADLDALAADLGVVGETIPDNIDDLVAAEAAGIGQQLSKIARFHDLEATPRLLADSQTVIPQLLELFSAMPDNTGMIYSPKAEQEVQLKRQECLTRLDHHAGRLVQINHRRGVLNSSKELTCPSCSFMWKEGFSESEMRQLDQWETEYEALIAKDEAEKREYDTYLERYGEVAAQYARLRGFTNSYPAMGPLWTMILENRLHLERPAEQRSVFMDWMNDVTAALAIHNARERLSHLENLARRKADGTLSQLGTRREILTTEIEQLQVTHADLQARESRLSNYASICRLQAESATRLTQVISQSHDALRAVVSVMRNDAMNTVAHSHHDELASIQRRLSDRQTLTGIVGELERFHATEELDHRALKLLAEELSPTEGMIAEDIAGFIRCLVDHMNSIIAQVWAHDLLVQPCGMESGELNYKFPLKTPSTVRDDAADVSEGSEGQQDMVDMAFMMTVMLYLDLHDAPLFLDEPGASFDEQHRTNLMGFIRRLVENRRHPQVYMISHYLANHGAFTNAQSMALDTTNITVPQHVNEHVVFH